MTNVWPDLAGRLTPRGHILAVRIYVAHTDFSGVVCHAGWPRKMPEALRDKLTSSGGA